MLDIEAELKSLKLYGMASAYAGVSKQLLSHTPEMSIAQISETDLLI
jgi:hypothetical protein